MALQLITGVSGSGKSTCAFDRVSGIAAADRNRPVFVLVPDQFSQEAGRILIEKNNGGILNIDVLSFRRLAYRALEEFRGRSRAILTDEGKVMLLRRVIGEHKNELTYFTKGLDRPGFLDECKSLLSEMIEYGVGEDTFEALEELFGADSRSGSKLRDIHLLYRYMEERLGDTYRMAEELIPLLTELVPSVSFLEGATVCLDGFTGFTPVQYDLIGALLKRCQQVIVTVTTDRNDARTEIFSLSNHTVRRLMKRATDACVTVNEIITTGTEPDSGSCRLKDNPALDYLERNIFIYDAPAYEGEALSAVRIRACRSEREEAAFAAREAARLIRAGADPASIAVVSGDPDRYEPHLRRSFEALGVPFFMDKNKSLGMNPLAAFVLSFLSMLRQGFDSAGVMRFLRCGVSPVTSAEEADLFENYLLATGRRGFAAFTTPWTYDVDPGRIDLETVNRTRETFTEAVSEAVAGMRGGRHTVREFATVLCRLLIHTHVPERLRTCRDRFEERGERLSAKEYEKLYPAFTELLDTMVEILGDTEVSLREFEELLRAGIAEGVLGFVPPESHPVVIGDVERTRLSEVEYLLFLGNTDRIFSGGGSSKGLLTERERERIAEAGIELAPSGEELQKREMFYLYRLITRPTRTLILTYPRVDSDGNGERPSYLIDRIAALFGDLLKTEEDELDESPEAVLGLDAGRRYLMRGFHDETIRSRADWAEIASFYQKNDPAFFARASRPGAVNKHEAFLTPETAVQLYGDRLAASVSRFESYVKCPYAHFLNYGLDLRERLEFSIEANDRGTVFHDSLERIARELHARGQDYGSIGEAELKALGETVFDEVAGGYRDDLFHRDKRREYAMKRMKRIFLDAISALRAQMRAGEFHQAGWEVSFPERLGDKDSIPAPEPIQLPGGREIALRGRIDRYDSCSTDQGELIKLVDYKTSGRELSLAGVWYGLEMQLMTYMYVLLSYERGRTGGEAFPAAVFYQKVDEGAESADNLTPGAEELRTMQLKNFRPSGYVNAFGSVITSLDSGLAEGGHTSIAAPLKTKKDGTLDQNSLPRLLSTKQFERLMGFTQSHIRRCGHEMYEGHIEAAPYRWDAASKKSNNGCDYCQFAGVCGVEDRTRGDMSRELKYMKDEEILNGMDGGAGRHN